ncbi:hypothetical protein COU49_01125 [Candidatus Nomurabacteria bacterium CG10_big_fil_rev_8_21_14_0_10_35_16]|uniref:Histidine phosphatase family protein n=1 Tax=Candidatus Nomurabacteria bacterium CG10_big_fil_rev_8_21_14_0_10_35_16 TaxID=1974731 RepID=A0A2H0TBP6_9BACT|nr:MAG: hypothetical protein COU49_01125 [Candidatus Nomurabacteria bacterium CG10_big_fil_rev_8_21_14_0_10_35_16]
MKWPSTVVFIRHGQSTYNALKVRKLAHPEYQEFLEKFNKEFPKAKGLNWSSMALKKSAEKAWKAIDSGESDYETALTEEGHNQAKETGRGLNVLLEKGEIEKPDIIYVSPYLRTHQTLQGIRSGCKKFLNIKHVVEERVREQEHGLCSLYNDWRIYYTLHPEQALLHKLQGDYDYRYLNGENKADVRDRARSFLNTLIRENNGQKIFIISHHLMLLCLRANLERWVANELITADKEDKPINCGVTIYKGNPNLGRNGKLELITYNRKLY